MAKKKSNDAGKKVLDFVKLVKDNKAVLLDMLIHPLAKVKHEIRRIFASWFLLVLGLFFLLMSVAEYLPTVFVLSKAASFGIVGVVVIVLAFFLRGK
tara:strand:- start:71 stop:361 length:291 start_codon:yes stop_codon:yes gene_type:complete